MAIVACVASAGLNIGYAMLGNAGGARSSRARGEFISLSIRARGARASSGCLLRFPTPRSLYYSSACKAGYWRSIEGSFFYCGHSCCNITDLFLCDQLCPLNVGSQGLLRKIATLRIKGQTSKTVYQLFLWPTLELDTCHLHNIPGRHNLMRGWGVGSL